MSSLQELQLESAVSVCIMKYVSGDVTTKREQGGGIRTMGSEWSSEVHDEIVEINSLCLSHNNPPQTAPFSLRSHLGKMREEKCRQRAVNAKSEDMRRKTEIN